MIRDPRRILRTSRWAGSQSRGGLCSTLSSQTLSTPTCWHQLSGLIKQTKLLFNTPQNLIIISRNMQLSLFSAAGTFPCVCRFWDICHYIPEKKYKNPINKICVGAEAIRQTRSFQFHIPDLRLQLLHYIRSFSVTISPVQGCGYLGDSEAKGTRLWNTPYGMPVQCAAHALCISSGPTTCF